MRYQQAIEIHERIETVLHLIETGEYSTPALAEEVGVSIPTISRIVATLRQQGHVIHAERTRNGWHYLLERPAKNEADVHQAAECKHVVKTQNQRHPRG